MRETRKLNCNGKQGNSICKTGDRRRPNPTGCGNTRRLPLAAFSRHEILTESKGMKSPSKSLDVFDFKEEDELTEMTVRKFTPEFGCPRALNAENYDAKTPELSPVLQNDFVSLGQAAAIKEVESGIISSNVEYGSSPGAPLEDHSNDSFPASSCNNVQVKSVCLASDAINSMDQRSPYDNNASSDGPSPDCFDGGDLDGEREGIDFYADYLDYRGSQYMDSVVSFSKSYVEARSRTIHEDFHIHMEIDDIVKIESQWSAQIEAGTINIYFFAKDVAQVESDDVHNASAVSRVQELQFPAVDPNWYQKLEAIESLDDRYKALWNVLLDTGVDSSLRGREDWMLTRSYFPKFERPFEEVIYPKGDPDAVSISKRDVDLLQPDTFVNDTIIDFYIKYLKTRQNVDERTKFHFFNSFFFRKLADMDKDPSSAFDGRAAFQRVRKWTRKVNLLEKDFILIPVNYNLHWSLIVICFFGEVVSYKDRDDESGRVPCILHMDSLRGTHSGLKDLMQSYLWEEWKERQKGTCEDLHSKFRNLKFVPLEVPQQQNSFDCGLFLLHYVELFLEEVPANFNIYKITPSLNFLQEDWFPPAEPTIKRTHIETLISGLLDSKSEECLASGGSGMHSPEDLNDTHGFDNAIQFAVKSPPPLDGFPESSLCEVGQGIELTLLPTSSARSTQCTKTSGLVLKELFKQESTPESFVDAPWEALESKASMFELKSPASFPEAEVKATCFATTELAKQIFQHPDDVTPEATMFPYQSEDYRPEAVYQPTPVDADSIPVAYQPTPVDADSIPVASCRDSGALLNGDGLADIRAPNGNSFFMENFSEHRQEANQSHNHTLPDVFESGDRLNAVECESPDLIRYPNNQVDPPLPHSNSSPGSAEQGNDGVGREWVSVSAEEQHAAKRMRISPSGDGEELNDNLSKDLNL
ncbi:probable ubiquitin-like-specific protease 2B isoform X3 [Salvia hispanica]|uniref:probable ubiquitin-like-specific protease 2B isoform X3 n=1 Tax=Salvia hispanica TaxID=49212 RepID=UPI00200946EC|nr:probable ubiquitin-like-specific protease 2B isoform X3 [Salvia hispanica]